MSSLKEVKNRIASVRNTLKITSAMKMVAAAKLHHAQQAILGMRPYEQMLHSILSDLTKASSGAFSNPLSGREGEVPESIGGDALSSNPSTSPSEEGGAKPRVAVVVFSSNNSLCGSFNANVTGHFSSVVASLKAEGLTAADVDVYTVGRKGADAARRMGFTPKADYSTLADHPDYQGTLALSGLLMDEFENERVSKVILVYNHYASNSRQPSVSETYLPWQTDALSSSNGILTAVEPSSSGASREAESAPFIVEPSADEVLAELRPKVLRLKLYTVLLDASAAEHAARTVAMQIASDNAQKLLDELTLEYNKSRQQKITSEILDLVGGLQR